MLNNLMNGHTQSCGCLRDERAAIALAKRKAKAVTGTPEHTAWIAMRSRCRCKTNVNYRNYGARGISVCPEWEDFATFLAYIGKRPTPFHSIDRIDNERGYEPGNVRWATMSQQLSNTRRVRWITYHGETLPLTLWARRLGISQGTLNRRIVQLGWSIELALTMPTNLYHSDRNRFERQK